MKEPWFYNRRFLTDHSELIRGEVVDVGCGKGKYRSLILGWPQVKSYTGVDFYTSQADIEANLNEKFPIESARFDTAICISVLEHLLEPQQALSETARILKPNGYLFLSVPWIFPYHGEPNDYFRYSGDCLKYLLSKAGFEIVSISSSVGRTGILFTFLIRWFPFLKKFSSLTDRFLLLFPRKELLKNTTNYQVIARKPLVDTKCQPTVN